MGIVLFFMIIYYRLSGLIAIVALVFNMLILLGALAGFGAALTLPGIAGLVLTIGIAVDANVLIFERIREELGTGKAVWASDHKRLSARIYNNFRCQPYHILYCACLVSFWDRSD